MNDAAAESYAVDLRQYLAILRGRKWTIIACSTIGLLIALVLSAQQTPLYRAEAQLVISDAPTASWYPNPEDEVAVVTSDQVADLVRRDLGVAQTAESLQSGLSADLISPTSGVIAVTYTSMDPEFARSAANSFARSYGVHVRTRLAAGIRAARRDIQSRITSVDAELRNTIELQQEARQAGDSAEAARLQARTTQLSARLALLQQELDASPTSAALETGVSEVLEFASVPEQPFSPNHSRNGLLGLFAGALLGVGVAFIRERLDDRFRGRPDVERVLEAPVLATVPRFAQGRKSDASPLPVVSEPKGPASEAYRNLRTGFQFLATQRGYKTLLVTSPSAHEGKTSTVANLGVALSQAGRRIVLVSADLRRPSLERTFGAESDLGLSTWLLGEEDDLRKLVLEHPDIPNLSLMTAGRVPSNPAELLTSPRLRELVERLTQYFDLVLFDSPPILPVADSVILASHLDSVILIFDAASTGRSAALHAKEQIERVGGNIIGCVLNAFDPTGTPYYYEPHYYSTYYGPNDQNNDDDEATFLSVQEEADRSEVDMLRARRRSQDK